MTDSCGRFPATDGILDRAGFVDRIRIAKGVDMRQAAEVDSRTFTAGHGTATLGSRFDDGSFQIAAPPPASARLPRPASPNRRVVKVDSDPWAEWRVPWGR